MVPHNHFTQMTPARTRNALQRIQAGIWHSRLPVRVKSGKPVTPPFHWGRMFQRKTFTLELLRPRWNGPVFLQWQDQGEATLYVDDAPYYGFDVAHRVCRLPSRYRRLRVDAICCQSAIWHPAATGLDAQGSRFDGAWIMQRDDLAWSCYHDLLVLFELLTEELKSAQPQANWTGRSGTKPPLDRASYLCRFLLGGLDRVLNAYEQHGLSSMHTALRSLYRSLRTDELRPQCTMVGHAHIDVVWLWPQETGELKTVHTFANANYLMDHYRQFSFSHSTPFCYEAVARREPRLARQVAARVKSGRWEKLGGGYVEPDTMIPCGEALAHGFLIGQAAAPSRSSRTVAQPL